MPHDECGICEGMCCDRAIAAEDDLTALRESLRTYQQWLADPMKGGTVIYRREVVARLDQLLAQ